MPRARYSARSPDTPIPAKSLKVVDALPEEVRALWLGALDPVAAGPAAALQEQRGGRAA